MEVKRKVHSLRFEIDMLGMSLDAGFSLSDEMERAAAHYKNALAAGEEINVEELVRKLTFFSKMLDMQVMNSSDHMNSAKTVMDDLLKGR